MEVITIEAKAFKDLITKVNVIASYVMSLENENTNNENEIWVDSYEVCTFLKTSPRTLQRLRSNNEIAYSTIRGRHYYKIGEIRRLLNNRIIKSNNDCLKNLVDNHKLYAQSRRNTKKNN